MNDDEKLVVECNQLTGIDKQIIQNIVSKIREAVCNPLNPIEKQSINKQFEEKIKGLYEQRILKKDAYNCLINL